MNMSLIIDALKKARGLAGRISSRIVKTILKIGFGVAVVMLVFVIGIFLRDWKKEPLTVEPPSEPAAMVSVENTPPEDSVATISNESLATETSPEAGKVTVGRKWSEPVSVPLGEEIRWERDEVVAYEAMTQTGKIFEFPRELKERVRIRGKLAQLRFRVIDVEKDRVVINYRFYPIR